MWNPLDPAAGQEEQLLPERRWAYVPREPEKGWFGPGLASGVRNLGGLTGSAVEALGAAVGLPAVEKAGGSFAKSQYEAAAQAGNPALETPPWREGGAPWLPYIGYQAAKNAPQVAAMLAAARFMPSSLTPTVIEEAGKKVPAILGGGEEFGRALTGATIAGYPMAVGSLYGESKQANPLGSPEDARSALIEGVPYAALDAIQTPMLGGFAKPLKAGAGIKDVVKHVATAGAASALEEVPQEALQTAMEQSFRPDLPLGDKLQNVVDAAITGGLVGGVFGGAAGGVGGLQSRMLRRADPNLTTNEQLDQATADLEPTAQPQAADVEQAPVEEAAPEVPVEEPAAPVSPYADQSNEALLQAMNTLDPEVPEEATQRDDIYREIQSRVTKAPQVEPEQAAEPTIADEMIGVVGKRFAKTNFFKNDVANAPTREDALRKLKDNFEAHQANKAEPNNSMRTLFQHYGLMDANGKPRNLDKDIAKARREADRLSKKEKPTDKDFTALQRWDDKVQYLTELKNMWSNVDAVQKQSAAKVSVREQPVSGEGVRVENPEYVEAPRESVEQKVGSEEVGPEVSAVESVRQEASGEGPAEEVAAPTKSENFKKLAAQSRAFEAARAGQTEVGGGANPTVYPSDTRFRVTAETVTKRMTDAAFNREVQFVKEELGPKVASKVVVVNTTDELPASVRSDAERQKFDLGRVHGVESGGKVYIVKSNMSSPQDVYKVLRHEALGHGGASALFGKGRVNALSSIYDRAGGIGELTSIADQMGVKVRIPQYVPKDVRTGQRSFDDMSDDEKAGLTDELLAVVTEEITPERLDELAGPDKPKFVKAVSKWVDKLKTAVIRGLEAAGMRKFANHLKGYSTREMASLLRDMHAAARETGTLSDEEALARYKFGSAEEIGEVFEDVYKKAETAFKNTNVEDLHHDARGWLLPALSTEHIIRVWGNLFKFGKRDPGKTYIDGNNLRATVKARVAEIFNGALATFDAQPKKTQALLNKLMAYTVSEINPALSWEKHTWLHGKANAEQLRALVAKANNEYRQLKDLKGVEAYQDAKSANEMLRFATFATALHHAMENDPFYDSVSIAHTNPAEAFTLRSELHNVRDARNFFKKELEDRLNAIEKFSARKRNEIEALSSREKEKIMAALNPINELSARARAAMRAMENAPYFHLGRFGDFFVSFRLVSGKDKLVDPKIAGQVAQAMHDAGFVDAVVSADQNNQRGYVRLDTMSQAQRLQNLFIDLQKKGLLDQKYEIKKGARRDDDVFGRIAPAWVEKIVEKTRESFKSRPGIDEKELEAMRREAIARVKDLFIDLLPDLDPKKVEAPRSNVAGFAADMKRSFAFRGVVGSNALANMAGYNKIADGMQGMREAITDAKGKPEDTVFRMQQVFNEISLREAAPKHFNPDWLDGLRGISAAFYLGLSPSYVLTNITALHTLLWPHLGKFTSHMKAAAAMTRAAPKALAVLKSAFAEGWSQGAIRAADSIITLKAIEDNISDPKEREFLINAVNRGNIDIGGPARELGRISDGRTEEKLDNLLRIAASWGYYSETFNRLVTALAAHEIHSSLGDRAEKVTRFANANDFASDVISQTAMNYSNWNTARILTKNSPWFGKLSPIMFQFANFTFQLQEKLFREFADAFKAGDPDMRAQARKFLMGHAAAMISVAGMLGLPFTNFLAGLYDRLKDMFSDDGEDPSDVRQAFRGYLADMFGADAGEILSHGGFRALGFDISSRIGEQDILPFSRLMADRRKWEDVAKDFALKAWGSPFGMLYNAGLGAEKIGQGKFFEGARQMAPAALKGPMEAIRMWREGTYLDARGNQLPMTPGARDVLVQLMGLNPANKAEYSEDYHAVSQRKDLSMRRASTIRDKLVDAIESNDQKAMRTWLQTAQRFDEAHPAYAVLPRLPAVLSRNQRQRSISSTQHVPLNANPRDIEIGELTRGYNWQ